MGRGRHRQGTRNGFLIEMLIQNDQATCFNDTIRPGVHATHLAQARLSLRLCRPLQGAARCSRGSAQACKDTQEADVRTLARCPRRYAPTASPSTAALSAIVKRLKAGARGAAVIDTQTGDGHGLALGPYGTVAQEHWDHARRVPSCADAAGQTSVRTERGSGQNRLASSNAFNTQTESISK